MSIFKIPKLENPRIHNIMKKLDSAYEHFIEKDRAERITNLDIIQYTPKNKREFSDKYEQALRKDNLEYLDFKTDFFKNVSHKNSDKTYSKPKNTLDDYLELFDKEYEHKSKKETSSILDDILNSGEFNTVEKHEIFEQQREKAKIKLKMDKFHHLLSSLDLNPQNILMDATSEFSELIPQNIDDFVNLALELDHDVLVDFAKASIVANRAGQHSLKDYTIYSLTNNSASFYPTVSCLKDTLEKEELKAWLKRLSEYKKDASGLGFYTLDKFKAYNFITKSKEALEAYKKLDLGFWDFMEHFDSVGPSVLDSARFTLKYEPLPTPDLKRLYTSLIKGGEKQLKKYIECNIEKTQVQILMDKLSKTRPDYISALDKLVEIYHSLQGSGFSHEIVHHRLKQVPKATRVAKVLESIDKINDFVNDYMSFADEQRERLANSVHEFNDRDAQKTLILYENFLQKSYSKFKQDFNEQGAYIGMIADVKNRLSDAFDESKLRSILNQIIKRKDHDLYRMICKANPSQECKKRLGYHLKNLNKHDSVVSLEEFYRTHLFLKNLGEESSLENVLQEDFSSSEELRNGFTKLRASYYPAMLGEDLEIPRHMEGPIDNIMCAYFKNTGQIDLQPALRQIAKNFILYGPEETFEMINDMEGNRELIKNFQACGINIDAYQKGISRTYHLSTDGKAKQRAEEKLQGEVADVYNRLETVAKPDDIERIKSFDLNEQLAIIERLVGRASIEDELREEIQGHIQKARSLKGTFARIEKNEFSTDVEFYVSTDPIESLHCGQYFDSCLSLAKEVGGTSSWGAVVQTVNSNMNVLYARTKDGDYLGRNRTVLSDSGILCTRFYNNSQLPLDMAWLDYLSAYAKHTSQDILIPDTYVRTGMRQGLDEMIEKGTAHFVKGKTVSFEGPVFKNFHGDHLDVKEEYNLLKTDFTGYCILGDS